MFVSANEGEGGTQVITTDEGGRIHLSTSEEGSGTQVVATGGAADLSVGLNIETQSDNQHGGRP